MSILGTSLRTASAVAGLAPGVVDALIRNRGAVLDALTSLPNDPRGAVPRLVSSTMDGMGAHIVRSWITLTDDEAARRDLVAMGAATGGTATSLQPMVDTLQATLIDPIVGALGMPDARMRATALTATLAGLVVTRHVLAIEPLASASVDEVVAIMGPVVDALLRPTGGRI